MMKEKSQVMDIDRSIYDIKDVENDAYRIKNGLTPEIIEKISKEKNQRRTGVRHLRGLIWTILPHM